MSVLVIALVVCFAAFGINTNALGSNSTGGEATVEFTVGSVWVRFWENHSGITALYAERGPIAIGGSISSAGLTMPDDPTRAGFQFNGWNFYPTGTGVPFTATTPLNNDSSLFVDVYARWGTDTGGGEGPGPAPVDPPDVTTVDPPDPTEPGNQLVDNGDGGWIELDDGDVPLGEWTYDEEEEEWIFDNSAVPLGAMPQTGIENRLPMIAAGFLVSLILVVFAARYILKLKDSEEQS